MTTEFYLDKELKVYLENNKGELWQIAVTAVPSFSQSVNQETVSTPSLIAGGTTRNSLNKFTKNIKVGYSPGEWSFSTYVRPFNQDLKERAVEDVLWESFAQGSATAYADSPSSVSATKQDITLSKDELLSSFNLYFIYENNTGYVMKNCVVSSANTTVDIGSLATISWSGSGTSLEKFDPQDLVLSVDAQPSHRAGNSYLGPTQAIDGNTAAVGYVWLFNTTDVYDGAVIVYVTDDGGSSWYVQQKLQPDDDNNNYEFFGAGISLQGDRIVVGSENYDASPSGDGGGGFYYFTRSGSTWTKVGAFSSPDFQENEGDEGSGVSGDDDRLGRVLHLDGDYLATGVYGADSTDTSTDNAGAVVMWKLVSNTWVQKEILNNPVSTSTNLFGRNCALSGNRMVTANRQYLYTYTTSDSGENWTLEQTIDLGYNGVLPTDWNIVQYHNQGTDYGTIVVGRGSYDIDGAQGDPVKTDAGGIYIFTHNGTAWAQSQFIINPAPQRETFFGRVFDFDGKTICATTQDFYQFTKNRFGIALLHQYNFNGTSWTLTHTKDLGKELILDGGHHGVGMKVSVNGQNVVTFSTTHTTELLTVPGGGHDVPRTITAINGNVITLNAFYPPREFDSIILDGQRYYVDQVGSSANKTIQLATHRHNVSHATNVVSPASIGLSVNDTLLFEGEKVHSYHFFKNAAHPSMCENSVGVAKTDNYIINKLSSLELGSQEDPEVLYYSGSLPPSSYDYFGSTMEMVYPWLMIGAYDADVTEANQGVVQAFKYNETKNAWEFKQELVAHNPSVGDYFGGLNDGSPIAISPDGSTCAIGAPGRAIGTRGAVYVFKLFGDVWRQEAWIEPTGTTVGDDNLLFGQHIDIYQDYMVVGSYQDNTGGNYFAGSAAIYKRVGTKWTKKKHLIATDYSGAGAANDYFGRGVAVYDNVITVAASGEGVGVFYSFKTTDEGENWTLSQRLVLPSNSPVYASAGGRNIKLVKDTLIIGEHLLDQPSTNGLGNTGGVLVYKSTSEGVFAYQAMLLTTNLDPNYLDHADYFGLDIDVDSSDNGKNITIVAGGRKYGANDSNESGAAYTWSSSDYGKSWSEGELIKSNKALDQDNFGISVATSNGYTALGSRNGEIPGTSLTDPGYVITYRKGVAFPITSANIQISNSLTPISYPLLGEMDKPLGFSSGAQQVSGSFSGYIMDDGGLDTKEFISSLFDNTIQTLPISLNFGGTKANTNRLKFKLNKATLSNPSISGEGIAAFNVEFSAEDTQTQNSDLTDIVKITYKSSSVA